MCGRSQFEDLCLKLDPNMGGGDIDDALEMLDENGDGEISFEEFQNWWQEEKASQVQAATMSLKDRMKMLMQQQSTFTRNPPPLARDFEVFAERLLVITVEREAMITKTDFSSDFTDVVSSQAIWPLLVAFSGRF